MADDARRRKRRSGTMLRLRSASRSSSRAAPARGTLAAQALFQAQPDGYTVAHHHLSIIHHPFLTKQRTWHPVDDFTYVMQQTGFVFGHVVHPASGWKRLADMWAEARRRPGELTCGTSGIATSNHLAMEELCEKEGV